MSLTAVNLSAAGAQAGDLDAVVSRDEAVPCAHGVEPLVEPALLDLDDAVAVRAHEVMMVRVGTESITELAAVMRQGVDHVVLVQQCKCPVDGREADLRAAAAA